MSTNKILSVIIPVYNEESRIEKTLSAVLSADSLKYEKEIIVVDDGSTDGTHDRIANFLSSHKNEASIECITLSKNTGKGTALKKGFLASSGDVVIVQDADLEYDPQEYSMMIEPFILHEADAVFGSRFISNRPHRILYFWHSVINQFLTKLSNMLTNLNLTDMETGFKAFRGPLIRDIAKQLTSHRFGFEPEITARLAKRNIQLYEVGISYYGRTYKEGKKIGWKDGIKAIAAIVYFNLFVRS